LRKITFSTKWPPQIAPAAKRPRLHPEGAKRSEGEVGQAEPLLGGDRVRCRASAYPD